MHINHFSRGFLNNPAVMSCRDGMHTQTKASINHKTAGSQQKSLTYESTLLHRGRRIFAQVKKNPKNMESTSNLVQKRDQTVSKQK